MARVLLGMSGGVDSTISAILLKEQGHEVIGLTMRLWSQNDDVANIKLPKQIIEAKEAANTIGIKHVVVDIRQEFYDKIISYFKNEYLAGKTPNPCAKCNTILKWEVLNREAIKYNCSFISTGHYVNTLQLGKYKYITKGLDPEKEQSFFLWGLTQEIISKAIFPLGKISKLKVREIATKNNLIKLEKKKESTGICFLENNYQPFLTSLLKKENIQIPKGFFTNEKGEKLGEHSGYPNYTVGQRRGLGLVLKEPMYVKQIIPSKNEIVLGNRDSLYKNEMLLRDYNFVNIKDIEKEVITKIRYRKQAALSRLKIIDSNYLHVEFIEPEWSIAPGQTAAFYDGNRLLGGGFIYQ
ncbi:MAG: tRNA 2-thiouridine(34) synthase MnmA [Salinivirgaceae bacterium]|nr:tRNA 2-thiouridine(34) synthase MnmA [Salinivirgaceae bacterium]